jgi:hypothetical protein
MPDEDCSTIHFLEICFKTGLQGEGTLRFSLDMNEDDEPILKRSVFLILGEIHCFK